METPGLCRGTGSYQESCASDLSDVYLTPPPTPKHLETRWLIAKEAEAEADAGPLCGWAAQPWTRCACPVRVPAAVAAAFLGVACLAGSAGCGVGRELSWDVAPRAHALRVNVQAESFRSLQRKVLTASVPSQERLWCDTGVRPPLLWSSEDGAGVTIKVLTYNLYWWNLFRMQASRGASASELIARSNDPPFDVLGFQECEDPLRVLQEANMSSQYAAFKGAHSICMAVRVATWTVLEHGEQEVAEDTRLQYFGRRSAQWMRLQHRTTGKFLFFANHHGPTPVNSGGACGGVATAYNLVRLIGGHAQPGDSIILVGDFNQDVHSDTVEELSQWLSRMYTGNAYGGVDHVFTNVKSLVSSTNLGLGGSDHDALAVVLQLDGGSALRPALVPKAWSWPFGAFFWKRL